MKERDDLEAAHLRLHAHRASLGEHRKTLVQRAEQQLDTIRRTIRIVEQHVAAGEGGGILAQRRLKALHVERARLSRFLARHGHRVDD